MLEIELYYRPGNLFRYLFEIVGRPVSETSLVERFGRNATAGTLVGTCAVLYLVSPQ